MAWPFDQISGWLVDVYNGAVKWTSGEINQILYWLSEGIKSLNSQMGGVLETLRQLPVTIYNGAISALKPITDWLAQRIVDAETAARNAVSGAYTYFTDWLNSLTGAVNRSLTDVWDAVNGVLQKAEKWAWDKIVDVRNELVGYYNGLTKWVGDTIEGVKRSIVDTANAIYRQVSEWLVDLWNRTVTAIAQAKTDIENWTTGVVNGVITTYNSVIEGIKGGLTAVVQKVDGWVTSTLNWVIKQLQDVWAYATQKFNDALTWAGQAVESAKVWAGGVIEGVRTWAVEQFRILSEGAANLWAWATKAIKDAADGAITWAGQQIENVKVWAKGLYDTAAQAIDGFRQWVTPYIDGAIKVASDLAATAIGALKSLVDKALEMVNAVFEAIFAPDKAFAILCYTLYNLL